MASSDDNEQCGLHPCDIGRSMIDADYTRLVCGDLQSPEDGWKAHQKKWDKFMSKHIAGCILILKILFLVAGVDWRACCVGFRLFGLGCWIWEAWVSVSGVNKLQFVARLVSNFCF